MYYNLTVVAGIVYPTDSKQTATTSSLHAIIMHWILEGLVAFGLLGITEVIVKPVAVRITNAAKNAALEEIKPSLQYIYDRFDQQLPGILVLQKDPVEVLQTIIISCTNEVTEKEARIVAEELLTPQNKELGFKLQAAAKKEIAFSAKQDANQ